MSTFPNGRFLLLSILIHLVALFGAGHVPMAGPQHPQPEEMVAVRFIDLSPAENVPEETPDTASIWSSKATKAHGGAAQTIAERSISRLTVRTPPKGDTLAFQPADSPPPLTELYLPDEPPSALLTPDSLTTLAAREQPIRLELEPLVASQSTGPATPRTEFEDALVALERLGPQGGSELAAPLKERIARPTAVPSKRDAAQPESRLATPSPPALVADRRKPQTLEAEHEPLRREGASSGETGPPAQAPKKITVAVSAPPAPAPIEPLISSPEKLSPPVPHRLPTPIAPEELAAPAKAGDAKPATASGEILRPDWRPIEPTPAEAMEMEPGSLKPSGPSLPPLEVTLVEDLPPSELTNGSAKHQAPEQPAGETAATEAVGEQHRERLEEGSPPKTAESTELAEVTSETLQGRKLRARLRLGGGASESDGAPKPGEKVLGQEELFPSDVIKTIAAKESGEVDLTDVSDSVSLDTNDLRYFSYFAKIKKEIEEQWGYPPEAALRGQHGSVSLLFILDQTGKVREIRFWKTSGYTLLDGAAKNAILKADPFPPFPEHLRKELSILRINARFIYELYPLI